jgi:hypothetical protein
LSAIVFQAPFEGCNVKTDSFAHYDVSGCLRQSITAAPKSADESAPADVPDADPLRQLIEHEDDRLPPRADDAKTETHFGLTR